MLYITKIPPERERRIRDNLTAIRKAKVISSSIPNQRLKFNRDGLQGDYRDILEQINQLEDPFNRHAVACSLIRKNITRLLKMSAVDNAHEMEIIEDIIEQLSHMETTEKNIEEHQTKYVHIFNRKPV